MYLFLSHSLCQRNIFPQDKVGNLIQKHWQWKANLSNERKYFQECRALWNTMVAAAVFHIPDILTVSEPF